MVGHAANSQRRCRAGRLLLPLLLPLSGLASLPAQSDPIPSSPPPSASPPPPASETPSAALRGARLRSLDEEFRRSVETFFATAAEGEAAILDGEELDPAENPIARFVPRYRSFAEEHAGTPEAIRAWVWIVENAGRAPRFRAAAIHALEVLAEGYRDHRGLAPRIRFLHDCRPGPAVRTFLETVWLHSEIDANRAAAGYGLARSRLQDETLDRTEQVSAARPLLVALIEFHADLPFHREVTYGERASGDLFELDHLGPGDLAPELDGIDLAGRPMRLSEHRGRVVLLVFRGDNEPRPAGDAAALLARRFRDEPFQVLEVLPARERVRTAVRLEDAREGWRDDQPPGAWARRWNIRRWPSTFLLDAEGRIRGRDLDLCALEERIESFLPRPRTPAGP